MDPGNSLLLTWGNSRTSMGNLYSKSPTEYGGKEKSLGAGKLCSANMGKFHDLYGGNHYPNSPQNMGNGSWKYLLFT
jgi:hypothetical protein